jgi:hypothetical protein
VGNKARCFFFAYEGEAYCRSDGGTAYYCTMFRNKRTYPRTSERENATQKNGMNQINNATWARANNADVTAPYPCAEGGYHALNTFITAVEVGMGTKYIHAASRFSAGICANDTCNSEATWNTNGGVRCRASGTDDAWSYYSWGTNGLICYNTSGGKTDNHTLLAFNNPVEQCMESQMAYSWAQEFSVSEGTKYQFYDAPYWFTNVATGASVGLINARVYKNMSQTFTAYNTSGVKTAFDCEVVLRMGLYNGMSLSGSNWAYFGGGYEQVGVNDGTGAAYGLPVTLYLEPDQTRWLYETEVQKTDSEFDFERKYSLVNKGATMGDGYSGGRLSKTAWKTSNKGNMATYECCYVWTRNYWDNTTTKGKRTRIAARFRGNAANALCAPRSLSATAAASAVYRYIGGSAQFLIE